MIKFILFIQILLASTNAFAIGENWINETVIATGDVFLRDSPPQGLFCSKGKKLGVITKGEKVRVLSHAKATFALFFSYDFIEVERMKDNLPKNQRVGFAAVRDKDGTTLFRIK